MTDTLAGWRLFASKILYRLRSSPLTIARHIQRYSRAPGFLPAHVLDVWRTTRHYSDVYQHDAFEKVTPPTTGPQISILMPTYNTDERWLRAAIHSVQAQTYPNWQLCIVDDASPAPHIAPLLREFAAAEERITLTIRDVNGHIAAASNTALGTATGEYVALLDHDDELHPNALAEVAHLINNHPEVDFIYTDEDKILPDGSHTEPHFKPGWSPELLLNGNYITHFAIMRRELVEYVGGFRDAYIGSQDHDLFLRLTEHTNNVRHIPKVLYGWRKIITSAASGNRAKNYAYDASLRTVKDALQRRGLKATATEGAYQPFIRVNWHPPHAATLHIIASNQSPAQLNAAATASSDDYLFFLDPTLTPQTPDWRTILLGHATSPNTAAVTAKIRNKRGQIVSVGDTGDISLAGIHDVPHIMFFLNNLKDASRETAAGPTRLLLVNRAAFEAVNGFDTTLSTEQAGPDLCRRLPGRTIYTPHAIWHTPD